MLRGAILSVTCWSLRRSTFLWFSQYSFEKWSQLAQGHKVNKWQSLTLVHTQLNYRATSWTARVGAVCVCVCMGDVLAQRDQCGGEQGLPREINMTKYWLKEKDGWVGGFWELSAFPREKLKHCSQTMTRICQSKRRGFQKAKIWNTDRTLISVVDSALGEFGIKWNWEGKSR